MLRWFLADLRTGRQILDLPPLTGSWERFLNAPERIKAVLDMRDPDTIQLRPRVAAAPGRSILAVAAGDVVLAAGPVWAHVYDRDAKTLQITAAGIWSYFDHRYVLPIAAATIGVDQFTIPDETAAGKTKPNPTVGTYLTGWEYGTIAKKWVQQAQAWTGGNVPIVFESDRAGTRERNFEGADFKNLGTVLSQLTQIENGPDIRFMPRLTIDRLGIEFAMQTGTDASPLLTGGPHQWDLTAPESSISNFQINSDATEIASTGWATAGRSADTVLVARSIDPTLTDLGYPLLETLDSSHTSVSVQATLDGYAAESTTLGRSPFETWDFTVEANARPFLGSFWEGDWCEIDVAAYDDGGGLIPGPDAVIGPWVETGPVVPPGTGDPYLLDAQTSRRRITYMRGDQDGRTVDVKTMERL